MVELSANVGREECWPAARTRCPQYKVIGADGERFDQSASSLLSPTATQRQRRLQSGRSMVGPINYANQMQSDWRLQADWCHLWTDVFHLIGCLHLGHPISDETVSQVPGAR